MKDNIINNNLPATETITGMLLIHSHTICTPSQNKHFLKPKVKQSEMTQVTKANGNKHHQQQKIDKWFKTCLSVTKLSITTSEIWNWVKAQCTASCTELYWIQKYAWAHFTHTRRMKIYSVLNRLLRTHTMMCMWTIQRWKAQQFLKTKYYFFL